MSIKIGNEKFTGRVDQGLDNDFMRGAVRSAQDRLRVNKQAAAEKLGNWEEWRSLGEEIRNHTITHLDYYLTQLSEKISERGGHVFFAKTAEEANEYVKKVALEKNAKKIVKSKSMVTEEIGLNEELELIGCDVVETDLGEYILQVDDTEPPSHIVAPALHKNKDQVRDVFHERKGYEDSSDPAEITKFVRKLLRKEFLEADIGITGCNFAIAESGSFALVTNEGNARLATTIPKTQITVMGMERIVPTWEELDVMVSLLSRSAVGQKLPSYVTTLTGPRIEGEIDGPEEFHLVIVDNGRSDIIGTEFQSILNCIRCGACINVCPVYRHIGGHAYGSIYQGPVGAVLSPLLGGYDDYKELPFASSLCGACTETCPVKIPLHDLLIRHREKIVNEKRTAKSERFAFNMFGKLAESEKMYGISTKYASIVAKPFVKEDSIQKGPGPLKAWTKGRHFPRPDDERFRDWFENRDKGGSGSDS